MKVIKLHESLNIESLDTHNLEYVIYYYQCEGYEGSGNLLAYKDKMWYTAYLGHCSCYGPLDDFDITKPHTCLEAAIDKLFRDNIVSYYDEEIDKIYVKSKRWIERHG